MHAVIDAPEENPELDGLNRDQGERDPENWLADSCFMCEIMAELDRAERIHPEWPKDMIYQAAIVNEESGELIKAVLENRFEPNKDISIYDLAREAIQVGAMAIRFLKHLPDIEEILNSIKTCREEGHE